MERTYAMIKPDAVKAGNAGNIIARIEAEGFRIVGMKQIRVSLAQSQLFYVIHKARPFYNGLTEFLASGPVVAMVLEKDNAIKAWRDLMGATNPAQAEANTIRKLYATSIDENAAHGSDAPETAAQEIAFFFTTAELV
jgi:nucleoside-diphosphate kinase